MIKDGTSLLQFNIELALSPSLSHKSHMSSTEAYGLKLNVVGIVCSNSEVINIHHQNANSFGCVKMVTWHIGLQPTEERFKKSKEYVWVNIILFKSIAMWTNNII
jgi:hypothetical protein